MCDDCKQKKEARRAARAKSSTRRYLEVETDQYVPVDEILAVSRESIVDQIIDSLVALRPASRMQEASPEQIEKRLNEYRENSAQLTNEQLAALMRPDMIVILSDILGLSEAGYAQIKAESTARLTAD